MKYLTTFLLLSTVFLSGAAADDYFTVRDGIANEQAYYAKGPYHQIAYFGTMACSGEGLTNKGLRSTNLFVNSLRKRFPGITLVEKPCLEPFGVYFGVFRTARGQNLFGSHVSSMIVVDYTSQGADIPQSDWSSYMEGIVRSLYKTYPQYDTTFVYSPSREIIKDYLAGKVPMQIAESEKIAAHYGIPSIDLGKYAADQIKAGKLTLDQYFAFPDSTDDNKRSNPSDEGAKLNAEAMQQFIDACLLKEAKVERKKIPEPINPLPLDRGITVRYDDVQKTGDWKDGQAAPIGPLRDICVAQKAGDKLTLKFNGSDVAIYDMANADSPDYACSIDAGEWKPVAAVKPESMQMRVIPLARDLDPKADHTVELKLASEGTARFGAFMINGEVPYIYAGLNSLERLDAMYASMDKIEYTPPRGRFDFLPKTMEKLKNGPELTIVMLGDSIIGNTAGSEYDVLLSRLYPQCKIRKIVSTRGSTGCWYYKNDNHVEEYVLRHNPDLLIIGGISQKGDTESIREVIRQVRAAQPNVEVLLIAPVFGFASSDHIVNWTYEIDTTKENYRWNLQKLASEEKCAFFDMTGPWWKYVQDTGKTYGWFMGDAVHANQRGCQIIGRLLEIWFQPE